MLLGQQQGGDRRQFGLPVGLTESDARQCGLRAQQQRLRNGRAAIADMVERAEIEIPELRRIDEQLEHGRNHHSVRYLVRLDGFENRDRVEGGDHDLDPGGQRDDRPGREVGEVEHRGCVKEDAARIHEAPDHRAERPR